MSCCYVSTTNECSLHIHRKHVLFLYSSTDAGFTLFSAELSVDFRVYRSKGGKERAVSGRCFPSDNDFEAARLIAWGAILGVAALVRVAVEGVGVLLLTSVVVREGEALV